MWRSAIISNGMPHPTNIKTAMAVSQRVRDNGELQTWTVDCSWGPRLGRVLSATFLDSHALVSTLLSLSLSVRFHTGAIPATIGFLGGVPCVGLEQTEIERLGHPLTDVWKTSVRDIAPLMARGVDGGTTVSG